MRRTSSLLLALALGGCASTTCLVPVAADPGAYVRGRVATADGGGSPLAAAEVTLTDAAGSPIAGLARARTDADGGFFAAQVPPGHAYVMVARHEAADGTATTLKTLVKPGTDPQAFQDLSPASTLLTVDLTRGRTGLPGDFSAATFAKAVDRVEAAIAAGQAAPDAGDAAAVTAWLDARAAEDAELAAALAELRPQVAAVEPTARAEAEAKPADPDPLDALRPVY